MVRLSFVPLIAPATTVKRLEVLATGADSFIYVVSKMGITGYAKDGSLHTGIQELCDRVRKYSGDTPLAVGFGVSKREHFESVGKYSEGVVIGTKLINIIGESPQGEAGSRVEQFCREIVSGSSENPAAVEKNISQPSKTITEENSNGCKDQGPNGKNIQEDATILPSRFGEYGGSFVPEALVPCLEELEKEFAKAISEESFWEEFRSYYPYMGRPSKLQFADRLTEKVGGARIWLKREDLNHTGSHKINNAIGQALVAKRLGKTRLIAETGAGQHGVATATVAAKLGMKCIVFMGAEDVRRQALNVFRMKLLGAEVVSVQTGTQTLRDAVNETMRFWITDLENTHYCVGSAIGPHPFPTIVRTFQSVIGNEIKEQMYSQLKKLPDAVIACVGGGSNAVGTFHAFENDLNVRMIGVEAAGEGIGSNLHSATLSYGKKGILHGVRTYVLQDDNGQALDTYSVSAGLDYPGVGPELSNWKDTKRATFISATDSEALLGFKTLSQTEGIIPALETSHAIYGAMKIAKEMKPDEDLVICVSGRGDKDIGTISEELPKLGPKIGWDLRF